VLYELLPPMPQDVSPAPDAARAPTIAPAVS